VLAKGYGLANLEDGRHISPRTNFDLGSAAKPFTALATLMLAEENRISLNDDVRRYVPELPDYGTPIRIHDLLQHTSGLRDYGALDILAGRETLTAADFLALLSSQQQLNLVPGTRHEYSHSDFELLGLIIERVAKEPFGAYLEREVLRPLRMTNSRVFNPRDTRVPERAYGYSRSNDGFRVLFNNSDVVGGGNLYASIEDLAQWDRALAEGERGRRPLVAQMLTRPTLPSGDTIPYAYGLRRHSPTEGRRIHR
jgi:CubicO group peptidase (beta-lactamase class C family)